jgi:tetratricopeptide (TPR) repeat protein
VAELSVNCPKCHAPNSVALGSDVETYTCSVCGEENPLVETGPEVEVVDPLIGAVISDCKISQKLGEGGFGAVYKAMDQNLQRPVALKVMLQSLTSNQEFVQKFIREAITAAQLNHPNIVAIHKVGRDEKRGIHYLIMELLDGTTLQAIIDEKGAMKPEEAVPYILQAAEALAAAHDKKIVHRDIKPENLMVDKRGVIKIMDFGLAKVVQPDMKSTKVMGTPHFMSPEQFEGKQCDGRTDIYSLGVTLFYLLSLQRPYEGTNTVQIIYAILTSEPKSLLEANPDVPPELWEIVKKMIHKNTEERYLNFRDVRKDLLAWQEKSVTDRISCPHCAAKNTRGKKFCRQCGGNLQVKCPACDADETAGVQVCGSCGAAIETLLAVRQNMERALRLKSVGDLRRAYLLLKEVLKLDPEHAEAQKELEEIDAALAEVENVKSEALELEKTGNLEDALKKVEQLLGKFPGSEDIKRQRDLIKRAFDGRIIAQHMARADESVKAGNLQAALVALDAALRLDPGREDIVARRKDIAERVEATESARNTAREAFDDKRYSEAFRLATEVLRSDPTDAEMAQILEQCRGFLESSEDFVKRGREHYDAGQFIEARKELEAAKALRPDDQEVLDLLEKVGESLKGFRSALSDARELLGDLKFQEAKDKVTEVLSAIPGDPEALGLMATIARQEQETRKAGEVQAALDEGEKLEGEGDLEGALAAYRRACEADPDSSKASNARDSLEGRMREVTSVRSLADEHMRDGRFEEALQNLERLVKLMPGDENVQAEAEEAREKVEHLSKSLQRAEGAYNKQDHQKCIEYAEQVLALSPAHIRAGTLKRDSEKFLAGIDRHLKEAERLIGSEIFEEAMDHLRKAKNKGATEEMVAELNSTATQGITASLKTEATRFYSAKDYGAALDAYERILELVDDADAKKGKKEAEKRLKALTSEPLALRSVVFAAAAVLLGMFQVAATVARPQPLLGKGKEAAAQRDPVKKILSPLVWEYENRAHESGGDFAKVREEWEKQDDAFDAQEVRSLGIFTAFETGRDADKPFVERILAVQAVDGDLDTDADVSENRIKIAGEIISEITDAALAELANADPATADALIKRYTEENDLKRSGLNHTAAARLHEQAAAARTVTDAKVFFDEDFQVAKQERSGAGWKRLGESIGDYVGALEGAQQDELRSEFTAQYRNAWESDLQNRFQSNPDNDTFFALVQELADMVEEFDLSWEDEGVKLLEKMKSN